MSIRSIAARDVEAPMVTDPVLSGMDLSALQQACAPVGLLSFPSVNVIRTLRQHGYVVIVLGGLQITPQGLERLLRERRRRAAATAPTTRQPDRDGGR